MAVRAGAGGGLRRRDVAAGLVAVVLFGAASLYSGGAFLEAADVEAAPFSFNEESAESGITFDAILRGIDPNRGDLAVRLEMLPAPELLDPATGTLAQDVRILVHGGSGPVAYFFAKGTHLSPVETAMGLYGDTPAEYPLDLYAAALSISATTPDPEDPEGVPLSIPVALNVHPILHGFLVGAEPTEWNTPYAADVELEFVRSASTLFFALFVAAAMWLLALTTVFISLSVAVRGREPTLDMMAYMGALLFAFPALRDSVPGTPPVGTFSDAIAFFWAEGLVALSLMGVVCVWLVRSPAGPHAPAPAAAAAPDATEAPVAPPP